MSTTGISLNKFLNMFVAFEVVSKLQKHVKKCYWILEQNMKYIKSQTIEMLEEQNYILKLLATRVKI